MWYGPKPTPRGEYDSRKNVTAARIAMSSAARASSDSGRLSNAARTGCGWPPDGRPRRGGGGALRIVTVVSVAARPYRAGKGGAYPALIRAPDNGRNVREATMRVLVAED